MRPRLRAGACALATAIALASASGCGARDALVDWQEARAEDPERPFRGSHVEDAARVLGPFAVLVERLAGGLARDLGVDAQVVTVESRDDDVSRLAERLFRERGVGDGAATGGVLILLDARHRAARLEVSYTLEGIYPDAVTARLARDQLAPYASYRAAGMAVMDVLHLLRDLAVAAVADGDLALPAARGDAAAARDALAGRSGGAGAQVRIPPVPADLDLKRVLPPAERARYAPSADPIESAAAYQRALRDHAGDPTLELFTPASRVMRARAPVAPFEDAVRARAIEAAWPLELSVSGDHAVLRSTRPVQGFVPVLLERHDGLWRVDLVEAYKNFFFEADGVFVPWNGAHPYAFAFPEARPPHAEDLSPLPLDGEDLGDALARLEARPDAASRFRAAELLFRNCWLTPDAMARYEEANRLAPGRLEYALAHARRAAYLGLPEVALPSVKRLGPDGWTLAAWLYARAGRWDKAERYYARALRRDPGSVDAERGLAWARRERERRTAAAS